jgi:hypothetical protein
MRLLVAALALTSALSAPCQGQEVFITGPLRSPPPRYFAESVPARFEWTYWVAVGALSSDARSSLGALGGLGGELTVEVLRYHGFPSGYYGGPRGDAELRVGPWVSAVTRSEGGLVEGGLKLHFGGVYHASFGTWDLRLGAGYGAFDPERTPHVTATLAYGVRSVRARYAKDRVDFYLDEPPRPASFAEASVARPFLTLRRAFDDAANRELSLGVELSPTFFFPPSRTRLLGGPP